jgi:hypothetical protein
MRKGRWRDEHCQASNNKMERRKPMSEEIGIHFVGRVAVWKGEQDDAESDGFVPVQITDRDGDLVEVSFDTHNGSRRTYLRFNRADLNRAVRVYDAL